MTKEPKMPADTLRDAIGGIADHREAIDELLATFPSVGVMAATGGKTIRDILNGKGKDMADEQPEMTREYVESEYEKARRIVEQGPPPPMFSEHATLRVTVERPATKDERRRHVLAGLMELGAKDAPGHYVNHGTFQQAYAKEMTEALAALNEIDFGPIVPSKSEDWDYINERSGQNAASQSAWDSGAAAASPGWPLGSVPPAPPTDIQRFHEVAARVEADRKAAAKAQMEAMNAASHAETSRRLAEAAAKEAEKEAYSVKTSLRGPVGPKQS